MVTMFIHPVYGHIIAQTTRPVLSDGQIHHVILSNGCVVELIAERADNMLPLSAADCEICGVEILI